MNAEVRFTSPTGPSINCDVESTIVRLEMALKPRNVQTMNEFEVARDRSPRLEDFFHRRERSSEHLFELILYMKTISFGKTERSNRPTQLTPG